MAEGGALNLKVILEAIDEMSGPLKSIGLQLDNVDKAAKAAAKSARDWAAIGAVGVGAGVYGAKLSELAQAHAEQAAAISESLTRFEQLKSGIADSTVKADAFANTMEYGAGTVAQEIDAITDAYKVFGNYTQALDAATAASRLAAATHADLDDTLNMLATTAKNTGEPVDQLADKFAKLYQVAGLSGAGGGQQMRQLERAYAMARESGVSLNQFLATAAEAQRVLGSGAARDLQEYYEESKNGRQRSSPRAKAARDLINAHRAEIAAMANQVQDSRGAAAALAAQTLSDPEAQRNLQKLRLQARSGMSGLSLLGQQGYLAQQMAPIQKREVEFEIRHPILGGSIVDTEWAGGKALSTLWSITQGLLMVEGGKSIRSAWNWIRGAEKTVEAASDATKAASEATTAASDATAAASTATEAAGTATEIAADAASASGGPVAAGVGDALLLAKIARERTAFGPILPAPPRSTSSTVNQTRKVEVQVSLPAVTVNVNNDGELSEQKIGDYVEKALSNLSDELTQQIKKALDHAHAMEERAHL